MMRITLPGVRHGLPCFQLCLVLLSVGLATGVVQAQEALPGAIAMQELTPPPSQEQTGYTPERYIAAYRRLIDAFARAFPHTCVFLNVGDYAAINDYAAIRGLHFRQDGLTPSGLSNDVGKRFYRPYAPRG